MYYDSSSGRYMSMDPPSPNGELMYESPFVYARNNPMNPAILPLGTLTIEIVSPPKALGNCGEAEFYVKWKVSGKVNGWVLQHVIKTAKVTDCDDNPVKPVNKNVEFTEGWQVVDGVIYAGRNVPPVIHRSDRFGTHDEGSNRRGTIKIAGTVKFVADYNLTIPPWEEHQIPGTGSLPTIVPTPNGWTELGTRRHELEVVFDCCCPPIKQTEKGVPS